MSEGDALDEVELARAQVGQAHRRVDDRQVDDPVEVDRALVPVVRVALEHDAVLRDALDELERARADRLGAELVALGLRRLGRDHHAGAVGQHREQRRERRRQVEPHRLRVDHVDAGHRRQLAAPVRAGHGLVALDVELDRRGVELLAVVEGHAAAQLDGQRLVVGRPFVAGRELRHDVQLLVDVEQLVAQRGEHDAADEGARQRRIEHVGVFGQADAQRLRRAASGARRAAAREPESCDRSWRRSLHGAAGSRVDATGTMNADCRRSRRCRAGVAASAARARRRARSRARNGMRPRGRRRRSSAGVLRAQRARACGQRVRKRQPEGGSIGLGTSPSSRIRVRCSPGSGTGIADSSACV